MHSPSANPIGDAATTPSPRALLARRALLGAVILGIAADLLLRNEPWGVGLFAWMALFAVVVVSLLQQSSRVISAETARWLLVAVLLGAGQAWRDSDHLHIFDMFAMWISLGLLAMSIAGVPVAGIAVARVRDLIRAAFGTAFEVGTGIVPLVFRDAELHKTVHPSNNGDPRRVGRALLITAPILVVFTLLLTNADPVFGSYLTFLDFDIATAFSHVFITGFFTWVVSGWLRRSLLSSNAASAPESPLPLPLGSTDIAIALGALLVLFAAFVAVQVGWLFGGEALVIRTSGLSYAAYARRGFAELTGVAALLLPLLLIAQALIPANDERTHRLYRRLSVPLVLLLGAIMVSAGARMQLYVRFYGISTDRLFASAFMVWLAIVFVWLTVTVLRSRPQRFVLGAAVSGFAVLFTMNLLNPDAFVARSILARSASERTGAAAADLRYVATLGGDAIPLLVAALAAPTATADSAVNSDRCAAAERLLKRWTGEKATQRNKSWTQWNSARTGALAAVRDHESELRRIACVKPTDEH